MELNEIKLEYDKDKGIKATLDENCTNCGEFKFFKDRVPVLVAWPLDPLMLKFPWIQFPPQELIKTQKKIAEKVVELWNKEIYNKPFD